MKSPSFLLLTGLSTLIAPVQAIGHDHDHEHAPQALHYIANKGQWPDQVLYRANVPGAVAFLEQDGITWVKYEDAIYAWMHDSHKLSAEERNAKTWNGHAWRTEFVGGNLSAMIVPGEKATAYHNYFLGNDPSKWAGHVPLYGEVVYDDVWPGIDLNFHSEAGSMKYDMLLEAGADPDQIAFRYRAVEGISIGNEGQLLIRTSVGEVIEMAPVSFYSDGGKEPIASRFVIENGEVRIGFPEGYDASRPVTIDPLLIASTLSGATGASNYGHCATYDEAENIYSGARNFGPQYPVTLGAFQQTMGGGGTDMSFSKYNPDGSNLMFATYLGGSSGENPHSMVVSVNQELCVFGTTDSQNFPITGGAWDNSLQSTEITVTRFSADGSSLIGSTFVGGSGSDGLNNMWGNYGENYRGEIILDAAGNMVIASCTSSSDFPVSAGAYQSASGGGQDGVVFALSPNCSNLLWSTYLGGSQDDNALGLRYSNNSSIVVTGNTESSNFPTTAGAYQTSNQGDRDGYVARISTDASSLMQGTYFGTSATDGSYFVDLDLNDDIWIYGQTAGNIPIQPAGTWGDPGGDIFIVKFDQGLSNVLVASTLGAGGGWSTSLAPVAFLVDVCDNIYISGYNSAGNLPLTSDALATSGSFYLAAFDPDMEDIAFATYFGGSHVDGGTSRFDKNGVIYQGVCSGMGSMNTTPWAWATNQSVGWDIGVFKIDFQVAGVNAAAASTLNSGCAPIEIQFQNNSTGDGWIWDFGDGSPTVEAFEPAHTYTEAGEYLVTLIAMDSLTCNLADTTYLPITIGQADPITADFEWEQIDCDVLEVEFESTSSGGAFSFSWDIGGATYTGETITHTFTSAGEQDVMLIAFDPTWCSQPDTIIQTINVGTGMDVIADFDVLEDLGCEQTTITTQNTSTGDAPVYEWELDDGTILTGEDITYTFQGIGMYTITLTATDSSTCNITDQTSLQVQVLPWEPVSADFTVQDDLFCEELTISTTNNSAGTNLVYLWELSDGSTFTTEEIEEFIFSGAGAHSISLTVTDSVGCSPPETVSVDLSIAAIEPVVANIGAIPYGNCTELSVETSDQSTGPNLSIVWDMGDGTVIEGGAPLHAYPAPGAYTITAVVTDTVCGGTDQMDLPIELIDELPIVVVGDSVVCPGGSATITAVYDEGSLVWNTGQNTPTITVEGGGEYWVTITHDNCQGTAEVQILDGYDHELAYEVEACPGESVDLMVPIEGLSYSWATGGTGRTESVIGAGDYPFSVVDLLGCPHSDTVKVIALDEEAQLFAPNAFTPDGDGVNDQFQIAGFGERDVHFTIFNRWGERLWESTAIDNGWDGQYNGKPVKNDVYVYQLKYTGKCNAEEKEVIGHVTVVR